MSMTVKEVIDKLSTFPADAKVTYYVEMCRPADGSARTGGVYEYVRIVRHNTSMDRVILQGI